MVCWCCCGTKKGVFNLDDVWFKVKIPNNWYQSWIEGIKTIQDRRSEKIQERRDRAKEPIFRIFCRSVGRSDVSPNLTVGLTWNFDRMFPGRVSTIWTVEIWFWDAEGILSGAGQKLGSLGSLGDFLISCIFLCAFDGLIVLCWYLACEFGFVESSDRGRTSSKMACEIFSEDFNVRRCYIMNESRWLATRRV